MNIFDRAEEKVCGFALKCFKLLVFNEFFKVLKFWFVGVFDVIKNRTRIFKDIDFGVCLVAFDVDGQGEEVKFVRAGTGCYQGDKEGEEE